MGIFVAISFVIGLGTYFIVAGKAENFFVAGRSLPIWVAAFTLGAQSIDANGLLGNADLSYRYHFWDGAVLPVGLGLSLVLNGMFLAHKVHEANVLTLPDIFGKVYGPTVEVLVSVCTIISFLCLLAGNLFGLAVIVSYVFEVDEKLAVYVSSAIVWAYTVSGGLFSVAYTDVVQGAIGWSGCLALTFHMITQTTPNAPPPSVGFPGYVYPDGQGDGGICDMYQGVPCTNNATLCCYNADLLCPSDDDCQADKYVGGASCLPYHESSPLLNHLQWSLPIRRSTHLFRSNDECIFANSFPQRDRCTYSSMMSRHHTPKSTQMSFSFLYSGTGRPSSF